MDVNAAIECVFIARFSPLKPENAGHDRITSGGIRSNHFSGGSSGLEYLAEWLAHSDFDSDEEFSKRSGVTALPVTDPKS